MASSDSGDFARRLVGALREEFRRAGRGSIKRTTTRLHVSDQYFCWLWHSPGSLQLDRLRRILEVLDLEPEAFFARVFPGGPDPVALFALEARSLARRVKVPLSADQVGRRFLDQRADPAAAGGDVERVERLERLRQRDPRRALRLATALARRTASPEAAAGALGVWASVVRRDVTKLDQATVLLGIAVDIAQRYDLPLVVARLAIRAASLLGDRAQYERGLALAEWATIRYSEAGNSLGQGLAHYIRGLIQCNRGKYVEAVRAFESVFVHFADLQGIDLYIASTWQCLGYLHHKLGRLREAQDCLARSIKHLPKNADREAHGRLAWVRAQLASKCGEADLAAKLYRQALDHMISADLWVDAAFVATEWTRLLVSAEDSADKVRSIIDSLTSLVFPLQDQSPLAAAAFAELIRALMEGKRPSVPMLDSIIMKMESERPGLSARLA